MYGIETLLTGRTLGGRYRIDEVIGRGGMGAVYRATDERLGRSVAVKVVSAPVTDRAEHDRLRRRFRREARSAAGLRHPNVVAVYDFGTDPDLDLDYLVMELLRGEDLAARLNRRGAPPLPEALRMLCEAARGLAAGHRAGLVHRDVKPGNVFLEDGAEGGGPHVRILDFGIALAAPDELTATQLTEFGRSPFSPAYASPEQLRGEECPTAASDVFSLGAIGYHLVTGRRCFTSSDAGRMAEEVADSLRRLRERAPDLPRPARDALVRALSRRPADRFPDAGAFAAALTTAVPGDSPSAPISLPDDATGIAATGDVTPEAADHTELDRTRVYEAGPPASTASRGSTEDDASAGDDAPARPGPDPSRRSSSPSPSPPPVAAKKKPSGDDAMAALERLLAEPGPGPLRKDGKAGTRFAELEALKNRAPAVREEKPVAAASADAASPSGAAAPPDDDGVELPAFAPPGAPRRPGRTRRLLRLLWEFVVSTVVMALFVAAWVFAVLGLVEGETQNLIVGALGSVVLTPLAVHRLTGSRGRYVLQLLGSMIGSAAAAYFTFDRDVDPTAGLALLFAFQLAASVLMSRFGRTKDVEGEEG